MKALFTRQKNTVKHQNKPSLYRSIISLPVSFYPNTIINILNLYNNNSSISTYKLIHVFYKTILPHIVLYCNKLSQIIVKNECFFHLSYFYFVFILTSLNYILQFKILHYIVNQTHKPIFTIFKWMKYHFY